MKQKLAFLLMIVFLLFSITSQHDRYVSLHNVRKIRLGLGPLSLAVLLKRLGARGSVMKLGSYIDSKCGRLGLQRKWIRIVSVYRRVISRSSRHPFNLRRFWYLYHRSRKSVIRHFLRSFIQCGRVPGSRRAIKKLIFSYAATKYERKEKVIKFVQNLKKIFFRRRRITNSRENNTIYPLYLVRKLIRMRRYLVRCLSDKRICKRKGTHCRRSKVYCRRARHLKRKIHPTVRKYFVRYFSNLFYNYISNPSIYRIRVYIIRRYSHRWLDR